MPNPFPGMNPYLEHPDIWPSIHHRLIVAIADALANLTDAIPSFPLPLRRSDVETIVDLQTLINGVYERAGYDYVIDYNSETVPKLSESEAAWADTLLREKGLR